MVKPPPKRQLQAEARRHITKQAYVEEGSTGVVHSISQSGRTKEILRKATRLPPLETATDDQLKPSLPSDCPGLVEDGDVYITQKMCEEEQTQVSEFRLLYPRTMADNNLD